MTDTAGIILRTIFWFVDKIVYWLIDQVYWLFSMLSEATLFTQDQITSFSNRIYVLVSIIMLFKLGFSFITYIVNPDTITDKQKGGGKLISNVVITIALLVSVPAIFNEAYYLQNVIFENKIIDKVMLGNSVEVSSNADKTKLLSVYTFMSFFRPTTKLSECQNYEGIELSEACISSLDSKSDKKPGTAYATALKEGNLNLILNNEMVNLTAPFAGTNNGDFYQTTEYFIFDYHYLVSTIVGGFLAWILLGFCFDLAIRSVKLGFLQIMAPIPILLSLTPGKKNSTLSNWGKECLSTWASLFVRVGIISFALNLILMINNGGGIVSFVSGGQNNYPMVTIFITMGILLFAKEFPKLLEDILGIKASGKLTLNPLKKATETPVLGKPLSKGAALGLAAGSFLGNTLKNSAKLVTPGGREKFGDNMDMARKEFSGRAHADITKPYSGDTQAKMVHKRNMELRDAERKARRDQGKIEKDQNEGMEPYSAINAQPNKDFKDIIEDTGKIDQTERDKFKDRYVKAYGKSHQEYAQNAADLDITKSQGVFLKKQLKQAEAALANATTETEKKAYATQVISLTKNVSDNESQEKAIKETLERLGKTDTGAAKIARQITAAKSAPGQYLSRENPAGTYKEASAGAPESVTDAKKEMANELRQQQQFSTSDSHDTGVIAPGTTNGTFQSDGTTRASNPGSIIGTDNKPINRTRDPKDQ